MGITPTPEPTISLMSRRPPRWARLRLLAIAPGTQRTYEASEWAGALVVVELGRVELECFAGRRWRFERGAVLTLARLPLWAIHNPGRDVAVLSALRKRRE